MSKALKILLIIIASLIGLVVLLLVGIMVFVDPNDFRGQISEQVEKRTGRQLAIGNIDLSVFPWLGLELSQVSLSNAPGFGDAPFARVEETEVRVKLMPLLSKQLEVKTIRVHDLDLNLARNAQGVTNWDDLTASGAESSHAQTQGDGQGGSPLAVLAVGGLEVRNANVAWDDRQQNTSYELGGLDLTVGDVQPQAPFDVELSCTVRSQEPAVQADIVLGTRAEVAESLDRFTLNDLRLEMQASGSAVPGGEMALILSGDVGLDTAQESLTVQELMLKTYGLTFTGGLAGSRIMSEPAFQGEVTLKQCNPKDLLARLGQTAPQTSDPQVLTNLAARLVFAATTASVAIDTLAATLDDTSIQGQAAVSEFDKPAVSFDLSLDAIDVDRYLPPSSEASSPETASGDSSSGAGIPLPVETLRSLVLDGKLSLGQVKVKNLTVADIRVGMSAKNGILTVDPAVASLYQGAFTGYVRLDVRQDTPRIQVRNNLDGIQAGPLLKDLTGKDVLSGKGTIKADLATAGLTPEEMKENLDGTASLKFLDGAVYGVNIPKMLRDVSKQLKGQKPDPAEVQRTDFAELSGSADIQSGLVKNNDLLLKSPLLRVTGRGSVNLPPETIDYLVTTKVVGTLEGQQGQELSDLRGVSIPIKVSGTFDKPSFKPDVEAIASQLGLQKGREMLEEQTKDIQEKIGKELEQVPVQPDKLLKGLFGNQ